MSYGTDTAAQYECRRSERMLYESLWQECFDYMLPRKSDITSTPVAGAKKQNVLLFDSTGIQANELLAATLSSGLTNPQTVWFFLTTGDDEIDRDDDVRKWMAKTHFSMHSILNNTNFHSETHEFYLDLGCIGTGTIAVEEDDEFVVRFASRHIREITIDEDYRGYVDTVDRTYKATPRQLVGQFGIKNVGAKIRKLFEEGNTDKIEVVQTVCPREIEPGKKGAKNYPFSSKYWLKEDPKMIFQESGYREFPFLVGRWHKASGEKYGRGPGQTALPDVKMLNSMMKTTLEGAQLTIRPPFELPHDGYLLPIRWVPGGSIYRKPGLGADNGIKPLVTDARIDFGIQLVQMVQKKIMEAFYVDRFELPNGPMMTATEVERRTQVMYRYMGPMLANLQHQFLRPLIDRLFGIMMRKGLIEMPPEILQGKKLDVRYMSPVAQAQRAEDGQKLQQALAAIAPFAQADPTVLDNFDGDEVARHIAGVYGVPEQILRDRSVVRKIREQKAAAAQKQQQLQESQVMAQNVQAVGPSVLQAQKQAQGA